MVDRGSQWALSSVFYSNNTTTSFNLLLMLVGTHFNTIHYIGLAALLSYSYVQLLVHEKHCFSLFTVFIIIFL